jgi:hypothetical protein
MKLAILLGVCALVGALFLPHHNTVQSCAEDLARLKAAQAWGSHAEKCDGLTREQLERAIQIAQF